MSEKIACEIWIAMNEEGDWVVVTDEGAALNQLGEDHGGYAGRVVKVTVKMAPPTIAEASIEIADEAGQTTEISA